MKVRTQWCCLAAVLTLASFSSHAALAAPAIANLSLRGLQSGGTVTLAIDGAELMPEPRLLLPVPIAGQVLRAGATDAHLEIELTLATDVPAGIYPLRVANAKGISNAVLLGIDSLPQVPFDAASPALPVAMHGALAGSTVLATSFNGKAGQRMVIDVEARRLGSALSPVLRLLDPQRRQLAWSQGTTAASGDARLEVQLPSEGVYTVELHDALYRGENPGQFRLKIGELHYADMVFPLGVQRGTAAALHFVGSNLSPDVTVTMQPAMQPAAGEFEVPVLWPPVAGITGSRPAVVVGDNPEAVESPPADGSLQQIVSPGAINGRIGKPGEEDKFRVAVQPGAALRVDVLANRAGSPLDGVLTVATEAGAVLGGSDDRPGTTDPGLDFTVPADQNAIVLSMKDLEGRGGDNFIYRISIAAAPDFSLSLTEDRQHVPQGAASLVRVRANRSGYSGPIKLSFSGLPPEIAVSGDEIPAGVNDIFLTISAGQAAPLQAIVALTGAATEPNVTLVRPALLPETPAARHQSWLRSEVGVAVVGPAPIQVAWPADAAAALPLGAALAGQVTIARSEGVQGAVRLGLLTTQAIPKKVENNVQVDDLARALRLEAVPTIAADQTAAEIKILVPADLTQMPYDLAVTAELLSADGQQVLARAVTPARRLLPTKP